MSLKKNAWIPPSKEVQEELFVFGYSCTLFRDDEKARYLDQGKHLIPWMGNESVKIDRYDCRGALHDLRRFVAPPGGFDRFEGLTAEEKRIEELCDEERYMALYKDEDEEAVYHEEEMKRLQQELSKDPGYAMVGFSYDEAGGSQLRDGEDSNDLPVEQGKIYLDDTYVPPPDLDVPPGMAVPPTKKLNAIIQRTAVFIAKQGRQMEIVLKTKQARNPQFGFLNFDHVLHPFYRHVIKMVQGGKYEPPPEEEPPKAPPVAPVKEESEQSDDESDGDDHYLHPSLLKGAERSAPATKVETTKEVPPAPAAIDTTSAYGQLISKIKSHHAQPENLEAVKAEIVEPVGELKVIIDKMASYVAKNGRDFEAIVKAKNDPRFDFIKADNVYRPYYDSKVVKYEEMVKKTEQPKKSQEENEQTKKEAKTIAPISFKLKPKEAEPVKLVSSSVQLGADELEEGEETIAEEQKEVPQVKQAVSINHAFVKKVRPQEADMAKPVEVVSGGFGVMKPSKPDLNVASPEPEPEPMELDSSSESEPEPEIPAPAPSPPAPKCESPVKKTSKPKPLDIFAEEEQTEKPKTPPPEPKKAALSIEEYKNRMLNRLKPSLAVESTVSTVEIVRPAGSKRRQEEKLESFLGESFVVQGTSVRKSRRSSNSDHDSSPERRRMSISSSVSSNESDEEELRRKLLREKRKQALSKWRSEKSVGSERARSPVEAEPRKAQTEEAAGVEEMEDRPKTPPVDSPARPASVSPDSEEKERLLRLRLEEKHRASQLSVSDDIIEQEKEKQLKLERKQRAALLLAKFKKEAELPAVQSLPNLQEHGSVTPVLPQSAPPTPPFDTFVTSSELTSPVPPEVLTIESDEDIQIIGAVPGKKLPPKKTVCTPSEDGEISSSEETHSVVSKRERSASSSDSASRRRSRSRSRHRSKDRRKRKKRDRSKKAKKRRNKDSSKQSSSAHEDRSSKHRKTKRRKKSDSERSERRHEEKKKRRKESRKHRTSSSSSSSSSDEDERPSSARLIGSPTLPVKDIVPSADVMSEDSTGLAASSVIQPTVAKLTEDLRAKVRALISAKPLQ